MRIWMLLFVVFGVLHTQGQYAHVVANGEEEVILQNARGHLLAAANAPNSRVFVNGTFRGGRAELTAEWMWAFGVCDGLIIRMLRKIRDPFWNRM